MQPAETVGRGDWIRTSNRPTSPRTSAHPSWGRGPSSSRQPVDQLLTHLGRRALDCGAGEFFEFDSQSAEGLHRWRAYRDRVADDDE